MGYVLLSCTTALSIVYFINIFIYGSPPLICPIITATPLVYQGRPVYNCFGMFVMTLHYGLHLKLAPVS